METDNPTAAQKGPSDVADYTHIKSWELKAEKEGKWGAAVRKQQPFVVWL